MLTAFLFPVAPEKVDAAKDLIAALKLTEAPSFENPGAPHETCLLALYGELIDLFEM